MHVPLIPVLPQSDAMTILSDTVDVEKSTVIWHETTSAKLGRVQPSENIQLLESAENRSVVVSAGSRRYKMRRVRETDIMLTTPVRRAPQTRSTIVTTTGQVLSVASLVRSYVP